METNRQIDQKREELNDLIAQAERQLMIQIDPYIASRRGVDFGEYFYNLKNQLTGKIFSEENLENSDNRRGLDINVQEIIKECYQSVLEDVIVNVRANDMQDVGRYVQRSYNDTLQQVQFLMNNIRNIVDSRNIQDAEAARLLQEADRLIEQVNGDIAGHRANLENLEAQIRAAVREQEAKKQEEEARKNQAEAQPQEEGINGKGEDTKQQEEAQKVQEPVQQVQTNPTLSDVDRLIASTDEFITEKTGDLTQLEAQLEALRAKDEEKARKQGDLLIPASVLASVDALIADTNEFIVAQEGNLAEFRNQLAGYLEKQQVHEVAKNADSKESEKGKVDAFRLSDEDMKKFNEGVKQVMNSRSEDAPDKKTSLDDLVK